ncbi:MAG: molybdopterin cofactor-binding domain-containing protein [Hyphomicrobiaceae bacterium]
MLGYLSKDTNLLGEDVRDVQTAPAAYLIENVSRRSVVKGLAATSGLVVAMQFLSVGEAKAFKTYATGADGMPNKTVNDPHVFVSIAKNGTVSIVTHRSEMGTGSRTSLPMVVADEMEADWAKVEIIQAPGDEPKYGNQDTDGSRSIRHFVQPMRQVGAAVRNMLEQAAAKQWGVDPKLCKAKNHKVVLLKAAGSDEEAGKSLGFGELSEAAMALPAPAVDKLTYKKDGEWKYVGKGDVQIYDLHDITTGKAKYGADVSVEGMKYAVVARPPVVGAKVKSVDDTAAKKVPGVEAIVQIPGSMPPAKFAPLGGVAVVAKDTYAAIKGRDALVIEWSDSPHSSYNTADFKKQMAATAQKPGKPIRDQGDVDGAFKAAKKVFTREYYQPHMAHAAMEPLVALANVKDGKAEITGPFQSPYGTRTDVAKAIGLKLEDVTVNVTLLGGGFGRKSKCDFGIEAAIISKEVGAPIRVQWTREDDMRHAFYATTSHERLSVALDDKDKVSGWLHRSVAPSILTTFAPAKDSMTGFFIEHGMGLVELPFDVPNFRAEMGESLAHLRIGWFRSVSNVPRAFAVQSFIAELAHEQGRDHKEVLLELLGPDRKVDPKASGFPKDFWNYGEPTETYPIDTARFKKVIELVAKKGGYGRKMPKGEGLGLAVHRSFVTYTASLVHVKVADDGTVTVPSVHTAVDCGFCVNPERVRSQMEGAAVQGHSIAMYSALNVVNGVVEEGNYDTHVVARMNNYPKRVHTHIVEYPFEVPASGVGEPGVPPYAPALYNAIFAATGKRIRELPLGDQLSG